MEIQSKLRESHLSLSALINYRRTDLANNALSIPRDLSSVRDNKARASTVAMRRSSVRAVIVCSLRVHSYLAIPMLRHSPVLLLVTATLLFRATRPVWNWLIFGQGEQLCKEVLKKFELDEV